MQKISGILPPSPRTTAVDIENSQPVRKGVPAFGRKVVGNDSGDRVTMTTLERAELDRRMKTYKPRDIHNSDIPDRMADEFFLNKGRRGPDGKLQIQTRSPVAESDSARHEPRYQASAEPYSREPEHSGNRVNLYA